MNKIKDIEREVERKVSFSSKPITLTPEELRKYKGCEHYTDEEAEDIINSLFKLSIIGYSFSEKEFSNDMDESKEKVTQYEVSDDINKSKKNVTHYEKDASEDLDGSKNKVTKNTDNIELRYNLITFEELKNLLGYTDERALLKWCRDNNVSILKMGRKKYIHESVITQMIDKKLPVSAVSKNNYGSGSEIEEKYVPESELVAKYLKKYERKAIEMIAR
jgi:hypothetical protein